MCETAVVSHRQLLFGVYFGLYITLDLHKKRSFYRLQTYFFFFSFLCERGADFADVLQHQCHVEQIVVYSLFTFQ